MIAAARQVVLLASAGKFPGERGLALVCGPPDIDVLITNDTSDPATLAAFREAGTEVITVRHQSEAAAGAQGAELQASGGGRRLIP
jgi:DeoR/GlpR family transcriptional regulator of sugar metabolism